MGLFDNLFKLPAQPALTIYKPSTEHEAWCAVLIGVMSADGEISDQETDLVMHQLVYKKKFEGVDIIYHYKNAFYANSKFGGKAIIEEASKIISEEYKATLFAMVTEIIMIDGDIQESEKKILEFVAQSLLIDDVTAEKIVSVFNIRFYGNVVIYN